MTSASASTVKVEPWTIESSDLDMASVMSEHGTESVDEYSVISSPTTRNTSRAPTPVVNIVTGDAEVTVEVPATNESPMPDLGLELLFPDVDQDMVCQHSV